MFFACSRVQPERCCIYGILVVVSRCPALPRPEHDPSPAKPGTAAEAQRFVDRVCLNKTSGAFLRDLRDNLPAKPRSLTALPLATDRARTVQTLLGFHEEAK